jgi:hypothetical protein
MLAYLQHDAQQPQHAAQSSHEQPPLQQALSQQLLPQQAAVVQHDELLTLVFAAGETSAGSIATESRIGEIQDNMVASSKHERRRVRHADHFRTNQNEEVQINKSARSAARATSLTEA